jgi:hypothetical protein
VKNLFLKIACVVVAILVWIQVAATTIVEADVGMPMEVVGLADHLTIAGNTLPEMGRVRVRAPKLSVMAHEYLGVALGHVEVDLSGRPPESAPPLRLKEADVRTEAEVVALLPPVRLPLRVDHLDRRSLPVRVPRRGRLADGFRQSGPVVVTPESMLVSGPRRYFAGIDSLVTEAVDLTTLEATLDREIAIIPPPAPLETAAATVNVRVPVVALAERVLANVPVIPLVESHLGEAGVSPPVCDVVVRGPADSVATLTPARLSVTVPVADLEPGVHEIAGQVQRPDWVLDVRLEPPVFMVLVGERPVPEGDR